MSLNKIVSVFDFHYFRLLINSKRMKLHIIILGLILAIVWGCNNEETNPVGQEKVTILSGTVSDASLIPLSGVNIFTEPATKNVTSDASGKFEIKNLSPGNYKVHAEKTGFLSEIISNVTLKDTVNLKFLLRNLLTISGRVIDDTTGLAIEGVQISIPSISFQTTTLNDGSFQITDIPVGANIIYLKRTGYCYTRKDLYINYNETSGYSLSISALTPVQMIYVQGGTFMMGDTFGDGNFPEKPAHNVTLSDFFISQFEVTQKQWIETEGINPAKFWNENYPVESVSWTNAYEFCNSRSELEGLTPCYKVQGNSVTCDFNANGYRLPTEAEWEYAARGGVNSINTKYSGSNDPKDVAWFYNNSNNTTHPVGSKKPNELGIYDMSGNVWEFCWDYYNDNYYSESPQSNPTGPAQGQLRSLRGGSWTDDMVFNKIYYRSFYGQRDRGTNVGIRLVRGRN